jgi:DNA polymerase
VRLYPIFHPAAALYTPRMLETLREDFARLPQLLAMGAPEQPPQDLPQTVPELAAEDSTAQRDAGESAERAPSGELAAGAGEQSTAVDQLGLF